jgi:hypothetical protein
MHQSQMAFILAVLTFQSKKQLIFWNQFRSEGLDERQYLWAQSFLLGLSTFLDKCTKESSNTQDASSESSVCHDEQIYEN